MKKIYFIFTLCLIVSCNNKVSKNKKSCSKYVNNIKENWAQNEKGVYSISDKKILWNENKNCLIGKTKKEIRQIFGSPNKEGKNLEIGINVFRYYLTEGCLTNQLNSCTVFKLLFDNDDKVYSIPVEIL